MKYYKIDIVYQEVPDEISLCFYIGGCPIRCHGCHSPFLWTEKNTIELNEDFYIEQIKKYKDFISCILFMGGEWHNNILKKYLKIAKDEGLKTCLYTGYEKSMLDKDLFKYLTYIKTGRYIEKLGGLSNKNTNQKFYDLEKNQLINFKFIKE